MSYQSKGKTTKISATSRVSAKIAETFYTVEFTKEVSFTAAAAVQADMEAEKAALWNEVHGEVDKQLEDIYNTLKTERRR